MSYKKCLIAAAISLLGGYVNAEVKGQYVQVVIPKEIRESMGIVSGQKVQMIKYKNRIELIPMKSMKEMKGFLKGINTEVHRDDDRI